MFNFLKRKPKPEPAQQSFTFIWYKKMKTGTTTHYTTPFRTTVSGKDKKEAYDKLCNFAMHSMKLCVFDEAEFDGSELMKVKKKFDEVNKAMENITSNFK